MTARDLSTRPVTMTHQHYRLIARVITAQRSWTMDDETADKVALQFANALASTNPRFDRTRFLAACGVED